MDVSSKMVMTKKKPSDFCVEASLPKQMKKPKIFVDLLKEIGDSKQDHDQKILLTKEEWQKQNFELLK